MTGEYFTFQANQWWGIVGNVSKGNLEPRLLANEIDRWFKTPWGWVHTSAYWMRVLRMTGDCDRLSQADCTGVLWLCFRSEFRPDSFLKRRTGTHRTPAASRIQHKCKPSFIYFVWCEFAAIKRFSRWASPSPERNALLCRETNYLSNNNFLFRWVYSKHSSNIQ